jgi:phage gp46-like protein
MDIRTAFISFDQGADYAIAALGLAEDNTLETAVILSLFTDRQANPADVLPDGGTDRRGWWADAFPVVPADQIGSRLWLLSREKQLQPVLLRAREYALEALQWLVDDGIAASVDAVAEIVRQGVLGLTVTITRPNYQAPDTYRYETLWRGI